MSSGVSSRLVLPRTGVRGRRGGDGITVGIPGRLSHSLRPYCPSGGTGRMGRHRAIVTRGQGVRGRWVTGLWTGWSAEAQKSSRLTSRKRSNSTSILRTTNRDTEKQNLRPSSFLFRVRPPSRGLVRQRLTKIILDPRRVEVAHYLLVTEGPTQLQGLDLLSPESPLPSRSS